MIAARDDGIEMSERRAPGAIDAMLRVPVCRSLWGPEINCE